MVRRWRNLRGVTLPELLMVVAIVGILATVVPPIMLNVSRHYILSQARIDLQQQARAAMSLITQNLRQAQSSTLRVDQASSQPYYSRVSFTKMQGTSVTYYQSGNTLIQTVGTSSTTLTSNLRYLAFTFPRSDDMTIVSVAMTLEKGIYEGRTKALHMASERVQVMNP